MNDRFNIAIRFKNFIYKIDELVINYPKRDYIIKDYYLILVMIY